MIELRPLRVWFVTGSQHLYGDETLRQVAAHGQAMAQGLAASAHIPVTIEFKPIVTTPEAIAEVCRAANNAADCIGLIFWMHTFSPAKMWIAGLTALRKPFLHLHTQYNRDIPWATIDMDFMNLNQSAHGDREFGHLASRMRLNRKVVVGPWQSAEVQARIGAWTRAAAAWHDWQGARVARFGDNMRQVAVTEGDKVEAQLKFGYSVNGYGLGDLVKVINAVDPAAVDRLVADYEDDYLVADALGAHGAQRASLLEAAKIELGLRQFLEQGGVTASTALTIRRYRSPRSTSEALRAGPGRASNTRRTGSALPPMPSGWISSDGWPCAMDEQISSMCAPSTCMPSSLRW